METRVKRTTELYLNKSLSNTTGTCDIHSLRVDRKMYHGKRYLFSFRTRSLSTNCPQKKVKEN